MTKEKKYTNSLINETSPYLLQHAHNPVNWHPWGAKAFEKAKKENKLLLISIGYAACHWCHVMELESFENEAIAQVMNAHFVCIKVDREERPDVDLVYMHAVQLLTGSGGWPLNCFALPDGRPIYGGTYFRPEQWNQVLLALQQTYTTDYSRVEQAAREITQGIADHELIKTKFDIPEFSSKILHNATQNWQTLFDTKWGGNKQAPKFALPASLQFLQAYNFSQPNTTISNHLCTTLHKLAYGGIYDQVGGGFARYSVDEKWKAPHFEKMLYDNGQLISVYSNAYKESPKPLYKNVIEQTLDFIKREMTTDKGAFYASYDADCEGVEGKFYVWDKSEIETLLGDDAPWFCDYFNVTTPGNWEGSNILWVTDPEIAINKHKLSPQAFNQKLEKNIKILLTERLKRTYPDLDDKVLTAWNALMSIGYFDAYEALGHTEYREIALRNCRFIENNVLKTTGQLFRNYKNNKATIPAFLDDYALSIELFIKAYRNTFDLHWLKLAKKLCDYTLRYFYDTNSGMFFFTHAENNELITRKMELSDNVIPASNSVMANNLYELSILLSESDLMEKAKQMLANIQANFENSMAYFANWGRLQVKLTIKQFEVVILGPNANIIRAELLRLYLPNITVAGDTKANNELALTKNRWVNNETLIYVCENKACKLPVKTLKEALQLICQG